MLINVLLVSVIILIIYFIMCYISIKGKEKLLNLNRDDIFMITDKRFNIFQKILEEFKNPADYELTFLNEIIKIRSQSQKYINENRYKDSIAQELKINKIIDSIEQLFKETEQFEIISEDKQKEIFKLLKELNKEIEEKTKSYNNTVQSYNKTKLKSSFGLFMMVFGKLFQKAELFKLNN